MQLKDKVFVVTGGGSGLGAETARGLVAAGAKVLLADVNQAAGEAMAAELGAAAKFVATDVTNEASATQAIQTAISALGGIHGLVNCAGVAPAAWEKSGNRLCASTLSAIATSTKLPCPVARA